MEGKTVISSCFKEKTISNELFCLGIDEAGRGPVVGPMIFGAAFWPIKDDKEISSYGFDGIELTFILYGL